MKTARKVLILALCAVLLVSATIMGTMAYLTSQAKVVNTFTVGSVAITLDETDVDGSAGRDTANAYKLLPGHTYTKDPVIHVASTSEDCYLFVKVVDEIADIQDTKTVAAQMKDQGWEAVDGVKNVYVYTVNGEKTAVSAEANVTVFKSFKIKDDVTNTDLANYQDKTITVTAYAVQKDGFESKTAAEIWNAAFAG